MKKFIAANWKMNHSFDETDQWLEEFFKAYAEKYEQVKELELVLCPPAILLDYIDSELMEDGFQFLEELAKKDGRALEDFTVEEINEIVVNQRPIKLGAQDCHFAESGSFTGDVSAKMLKNVGCRYVIIGHSERRLHHCEENDLLAKKLSAAAKENLVPIFCVGESKEVRDTAAHLQFVEKQLVESITADLKLEKLVIAYEPIWSIGTGVIPTLEQIKEMIDFIRKNLGEKFSNVATEFTILYGGSVTAENSAEILKISDGLLIGKASLDAVEFIKIASS
jgi:triosephosphate isomerase